MLAQHAAASTCSLRLRRLRRTLLAGGSSRQHENATAACAPLHLTPLAPKLPKLPLSSSR